MEHREITLKLSAFLDNELNESLRHDVEAHIKSCPECSRELEIMRGQQVYLKGAAELEPSSAFRAKITEKISAKSAGSRSNLIGKLIPIPMALSLLILIFSAYMVMSPLAYGLGDDTLKQGAPDMAKNALIACYTGSVFAPAAFAKFCDTCNINACACCKAKCGDKCKMTGGK